jgi:hypothetical protein
MSEDGSGYVDPAGFLEGDPIRKEDVNATADAWNYVEERVSDINIREEGLSRVNIEPSTWRQGIDTRGSCSKSGFYNGPTPKSYDGWHPIVFYGVDGGVSSNYGEIEFDWDPQKDTYAIIRASLSFRFDVGMLGGQGRSSADVDCSHVSARENQKFRFGILFWRVGESGFINQTKTETNPDGRFFSPVQIHLNPDFAETANGKRGPIRFRYDRRSRMAGTITLIAAGQSWENEYCDSLEKNNKGLDLREKGTYRAQLVWKGAPLTPHFDYGVYKSSLGDYEGENINCDVGRMNMYVQVFRR